MLQTIEQKDQKARLEEIRAAMLRWFASQQRTLPWRETKDPYAIWLSEIMLQQTRVETVKAYYKKFLAHFPKIQDLAEADLGDVLTLWSGLGYYRRARNLHKAAQHVVEVFDGQFPSTFEDILSLPGVGRYTAGAIGSIAFSLPLAAVDGNVHRVMSRLFCIEEARGSKELDKQSWFWTEQMVEGENIGDFNQSLMELGAMVCTPRSPTCLLCPIQTYCEAYKAGKAESLPLPKPKKAVKELHVAWVILKRTGKVLLVQRPESGLFAGMWELPGFYADNHKQPAQENLAEIVKQIGLTVSFEEQMGSYKHILTHRKLNITVFRSHSLQGRIKLPRTQWKWVAMDQVDKLAISSITRRILVDSFGQ